MNTHIYILIVLVTFGCSSKPTQDKDQHTDQITADIDTSASKFKESVNRLFPLEQFWLDFKQSLADNDTSIIIDFFHLPIHKMPLSFDPNGDGMTRGEFLKNYDRLFFPLLREKVLETTFNDFKMSKYIPIGDSLRLDNEFVQYVTIDVDIIYEGETFGQTTSFIFGEIHGEFKIISIAISN